VTPHAIAYWTALQHYGYTEQIPGTIFVATTVERRPVTLTVEELGLTYRLVMLAPYKFFGLQRIWIEGQAITVTDPAKTAIDCLDHPEYCGGIAEGAKGLYETLVRGDSSPQLLTEYASRMRNRTIFKRLGYLAETGYSLLDPLAGDHGRYCGKWQLRLNRTVADLTDWMVH